MVQVLSTVLLVTSILTFGQSALAGDAPNEKLKQLLKDCDDEPAAVSSLESLIEAASLAHAGSRSHVSTLEAAAKLDALPLEASVATYMEALDIPASVGFEVAELNRESRLAQSASVQKTGNNKAEPYDPCRLLLIPQYKYYDKYKSFESNNAYTRKQLLQKFEMLLEMRKNDSKLEELLESLRKHKFEGE